MRFPWGIRLLLGVVTVVIVGAVGLGIYIGDSPWERRSVRLDQQRVRDLQGLSRAVSEYWKTNEELPETLDDLKDSRARVQTVNDPVTGQRYEYRPLKEANFELCAVFETDSSQRRFESNPSFAGGEWAHGAGRSCFEQDAKPETRETAPVPRSWGD